MPRRRIGCLAVMLLLTACAADSGAGPNSGPSLGIASDGAGRVIASCDLLPTGHPSNCLVTSATNPVLVAPATAALEKSIHRVTNRDGQPIPNQRHSYTVTFDRNADGHTSDPFHFSVACTAGTRETTCSTKADQPEDQRIGDRVSHMIKMFVGHWPQLVTGARVFDVEARTSTGIQVVEQTPVLFGGTVIVSQEWACPPEPSGLFSDGCVSVVPKTLVPNDGSAVPLDYRYEALIIGINGLDANALHRMQPRPTAGAGVAAPQGQ